MRSYTIVILNTRLLLLIATLQVLLCKKGFHLVKYIYLEMTMLTKLYSIRLHIV